MDLSRHAAVSRSTDQTTYINMLIKLINSNHDKFNRSVPDDNDLKYQ